MVSCFRLCLNCFIMMPERSSSLLMKLPRSYRGRKRDAPPSELLPGIHSTQTRHSTEEIPNGKRSSISVSLKEMNKYYK